MRDKEELGNCRREARAQATEGKHVLRHSGGKRPIVSKELVVRAA